MKNRKRTLLAVLLLVLTVVSSASATLPPTQPDQGPYACYRVLWQDRWYFLGYFWEDQSCTFPWCFDNVVCFYRY